MRQQKIQKESSLPENNLAPGIILAVLPLRLLLLLLATAVQLADSTGLNVLDLLDGREFGVVHK